MSVLDSSPDKMVAQANEPSSPPPLREAFAHIPGWGSDLDRRHRPAVPMEHMPPRLAAAPLQRPSDQPVDVEVLRSSEHSGMTPLFGSTLPPRGASGQLRRVAFRYSENDLRHWLLLLLADRTDVVEGLADDLSRGHVPNLYAEMGGRAAWRHEPMSVVRKTATVLVVGALAWSWWRGRARR